MIRDCVVFGINLPKVWEKTSVRYDPTLHKAIDIAWRLHEIAQVQLKTIEVGLISRQFMQSTNIIRSNWPLKHYNTKQSEITIIYTNLKKDSHFKTCGCCGN